MDKTLLRSDFLRSSREIGIYLLRLIETRLLATTVIVSPGYEYDLMEGNVMYYHCRARRRSKADTQAVGTVEQIACTFVTIWTSERDSAGFSNGC